ncbi:MAG: HlyD family efflux transporter periplasmic adaptor subunit [Oscillospiraceae bacterium]
MKIINNHLINASKKLLILILLSAILAVIFLPQYLFKTKNANAVIANEIKYKDEISVKGQIVSGEETNVHSDYPVVAKKISCNVGSKVKKGDILATVDKKSTINRYSELLSNFGINVATASLQNLIDTFKTLPSALIEKIPFNVDTIKEKIPTDASTVLVKDILKEENIPDSFKSPCDGYVSLINLSYTDLSSMGKPIITLTSSNKLMAKVQVKESDIGKIAQGMEATLLVDASNMQFNGVVESISPVARKATSLLNSSTIVDVFISLPENAAIKNGFNTTATIYYSSEKRGIAIPFEAINQNENGDEFCYILENNKAIKKQLKVDKECENYAITTGNVKINDIILTDFKDEIVEKDGEMFCIDSIKNIPIN